MNTHPYDMKRHKELINLGYAHAIMRESELGGVAIEHDLYSLGGHEIAIFWDWDGPDKKMIYETEEWTVTR